MPRQLGVTTAAGGTVVAKARGVEDFDLHVGVKAEGVLVLLRRGHCPMYQPDDSTKAYITHDQMTRGGAN